MKKNFVIAYIGLILFSLVNFTGCWNPIFYELRKDVKPETATVSGNISQITRYTIQGKEYLFLAADGGIRFKEASNTIHGTWFIYPAPVLLSSYSFDSSSFTGQQVIAVYANSTTLYAVTAAYTTTGSEGTTKPAKIFIWGKTITALDSSEEWKLINSDESIDYFPIVKNTSTDYYYSLFNMFQTNTPQAAHRHFYFCTSSITGTNKYYEVVGTSAPVEITISKVEDGTEAVPLPRVFSAAYHKGAVKFFNSRAVTTNETEEKDATRVYYSFLNYLFYSDDNNNYVVRTNAGDYISSLATCKDSILIGRGAPNADTTHAGITKTTLDENGVPGEIIVPFATNAAFQLTETYPVVSLINATPSNNENSSILYASVTFYGAKGVYDNIGLWSYYPERGNWNRE